MEKDIYEFLEECELDLVQQLCQEYPELTLDQIENIVEDFSIEINKQILYD
jgi:hypothetical protein